MKQQTKKVKFKQGLYFIRYLAAEDKNTPPQVVIETESASKDDVDFMHKTKGNESLSIGSFVIVRINQESELLIHVLFQETTTNPQVTLKIDELTIDFDTNKDVEKLSLPLALKGHVQWQGDVVVKEGEVLGEPDKQWRVEAFSLDMPVGKLEGVDIEYSANIADIGRSPVVSQGQMVGTKAKSLPITGLTVKLIGENADRYDLVIDSYFSTTGKRTVIADGSLISGLHKGDYLTGLSATIKSKE
jgi:hypothetical protein